MIAWRGGLSARIAAALLGLAALWAGASGVAGAFGAYAQQWITHWLETKETPNQETRDRTRAALSVALRLNPMHPNLQAALGDLYLLDATDGSVRKAGVTGGYREALKHYRRSARLRPAWPYTWANIAAIKLRLAEFDEEFEHALTRACVLGAGEPGVQRVVTGVGLAAWPQLSEPTRAVLVRLLKRGLRRQAATILALAVHHRRVKVIRPLVAGNARLEAMLERALARERGA